MTGARPNSATGGRPVVGNSPAARERLLGRVVDHLAANGIADTSLRSLAAAVSSSHRMLLYHFGSREGLLSAVVDAVERRQRDLLAAVLAESNGDPAERAARYWYAVTEAALVYGPLFFELAGHAMQGREHAARLRHDLIEPWLAPLQALWEQAGVPDAAGHARLGLAVARGLLFDLLLTGDRDAVDAAMALFGRAMAPPAGAMAQADANHGPTATPIEPAEAPTARPRRGAAPATQAGRRPSR